MQPSFNPLRASDRPAFYPTSSRYLWNEVRKDDTIWMIGVTRIGGRLLPPALDGKLVVGNCWRTSEKKMPAGPGSQVSDRSFWFEPGEGSTWYPWLDAADQISKLDLRLKDGAPRRLPQREDGNADGCEWWRTWGNLIRAGSKLSDKSGTVLQAHADRALSRTVFISYAWRDGARLAARLAEIFPARRYLFGWTGFRHLGDWPI